ncbi:hypothetical protein CJF43_23685 [Pseudomonas fragi]|uniref:Uncharacterized protein n=1 Tax=Pseudomonas fragi TaxID=296 RepID=A0A266LMK6_PSEFR|nr:MULTISPECIES: hypothetical protein [Pseudomonas]OZY39279.1 hypothetical protein CJF43_23685 [Pseudomonas fragi]HBP50055.1 hypothetical protein [Pseudomonas sp.]
MASKPTPPDEVPSAPVAYRDTAFISRTLVMRDGRLLQVSAHRVEAPDAEAQAFLDAHPDLERLPE